MKSYLVKCKKCKQTSKVKIQNNEAIYWEEIGGIISGRKRLDGQWGWQCLCNNNSIMTAQEKRVIKNPAIPTPAEINEILQNFEAEQVIDTADGLLVNNFILKEI